MNIDWIREVCRSFPRVTEQVTWGADLTFRVGGKIFAVTVLEPAPVWLSFKCSPENFADLTERAGIIPAPYLARAQWVALETKDALPANELATLLRESYDMVFARLPKRVREGSTATAALRPNAAKGSARKRKTQRKQKTGKK